MIRGQLAAADYRRITDQRMSDSRVEAPLAVNERGVPTGCRVSHSSGNPAMDERTLNSTDTVRWPGWRCAT